MSTFRKRYGPWALVTGASAGIGREYAVQCAERGLHVVLVARREPLLQQLAADLSGRFGVQTRVIVADLSRLDALARITHETQDLDIGLVINNAGTGVFGPMLDHALDDELFAIDLNVRAPLYLSHVFARRLRDRGHGGLLIVSSMVALLGVARFANYAATKAYDLTLAEGLRAEIGDRVDVHAVLPGFTHSEYMDQFDASGIPMPLARTADLVRGSLDGLGRSSSLLVPGWLNWLSVQMMSAAPRWVNTALFGWVLTRLRLRAPAPVGRAV